MWTWSIALTCTKAEALMLVPAQTLSDETVPVIGSDGGTQLDENEDPMYEVVVRSQGEKDQFAAAKAELLAKLAAIPDGMHCAVSCSGNAVTYTAHVRPLAKRAPNVHDLLEALEEADREHGLDKWPGALERLAYVKDTATERRDAKLLAVAMNAAAKGTPNP